MRRILVLAVLVSACSRPANPPPFPAGELVDLSHSYDAQAIFWPTAEGFTLRKDADGITDKGYYYASNSFFSAEHGGTHIDAPVHFAQGHQSVDQIPLERLVGPALIVDVVDASERNPDYQVTVEDLQRFEREHGQIGKNAILLLRTGFSRRWPDAQRYLGTAERGEQAVAKLHFPGLHPDAAKWIVTNRPVRAIGIDTASIDYGQSRDFIVHQIAMGADVPGFENVAHLEKLPARGAYVIALPMKIAGGSGGPLRIVALIPKH